MIFNCAGKDRCRDSDSSFGLHSPDNLVPGAGQEALQVMYLIFSEMFITTYLIIKFVLKCRLHHA